MQKLVPALILGREGSVGFPGKNTTPVLGHPLMWYPMNAAKTSPLVTHHFFSTDSLAYQALGREWGWEIIDRPRELATSHALGEHAYLHGYRQICERLKSQGEIEFVVLLFCNAATVTSDLIDEGIRTLRSRPDLDSAVSVSRYNMWSPLRARRVNDEGLLQPMVPFETFGNPKTLNCDRDSQGDVWFADMGVSVVRTRCLEQMDAGMLPQKWMGQRIFPLKSWGGLDVDYEWQLPQVEFWLKKMLKTIRNE